MFCGSRVNCELPEECYRVLARGEERGPGQAQQTARTANRIYRWRISESAASGPPAESCEVGDASLDVGVLNRLCKETTYSIFRSSTTARPWTAKERADSHYADPPGRRRGGAIRYRADIAGSGEGARGRPGPGGGGRRRVPAGLQDPRLRQDALQELAEGEQGHEGPQAKAQGDTRPPQDGRPRHRHQDRSRPQVPRR